MSPDTQRLVLRHIGISLIIALLMLLAGAGLFWISQQNMAKARSEQSKAQQEARSLHERYISTSRDEPLIRQTIERFKTLSQQGLIGPENRLEWANTVRQAADKRRLGQLEFSIEPQHSLSKLDTAGHFQLSASTMRIRLDVLHEGELLRFLGDLGQQTNAFLHTRKCSITSQTGSTSGEVSLLKTECELDWITITPAPSLTQQP